MIGAFVAAPVLGDVVVAGDGVGVGRTRAGAGLGVGPGDCVGEGDGALSGMTRGAMGTPARSSTGP